MKNSDIKKILIIRLSALGDTIHTLPMANAIRKHFPDAQIDWVVESKASKFIINNPLIDNVYEIPKNKTFKDLKNIIKKIRAEKYDIALDPQQLFKSGIILGFSGAKRRITLDGGREFSFIFANEIIKTGRKPFDINYHVVKRNLDIAKYLGCEDLTPQFVIPDFKDEISSEIKKVIENTDKSKKTITIAPATTWYNKHWTESGWSEVINYLKDKYNVIITASNKEKELTGRILANIEKTDNIYDLSGMTELQDLVYIYSHSDIVISPDSGSAHIAWAAGIPNIITLFFATSAKRTAPYGDKYYSLSPDVRCHPCMKRKCINRQKPMECLNYITTDKIINIVKNVLQEN